MRPAAELLGLPVEQAARWLALGFLEEAEAGHRRLDEGGDAEALHDFRVGLRRLRSTLRAYAEPLSASIGKKDVRRVRRLARATGGSRDAEVHIEWLEKRIGDVPPDERPGWEWLLERLCAEKSEADRELEKEVARDFGRERRRLERRLRELRIDMRLGEPVGGPPLAVLLGGLAERMAADLRDDLARVRGIEDQERAHDGRIAAKRLRYLLEPFKDEIEGAGRVVKQLKQLQDVLGEMHDADVLLARVREALDELGASGSAKVREYESSKVRGSDASPDGVPAESAGDGPADDAASASGDGDGDRDAPAEGDPVPGLRGLERMLEEERGRLFAAFSARWLNGGADELFVQVAEVGSRAAGHGRPDTEIERKYLLKRMPRLNALEGVVVQEIDQGWLPGERLAERLRRVRAADGTRKWFRTVKLGSGISRMELEEETTEAVFKKLWSLTRGKRVRKVRYKVPVDGLVWEIDRFRGRKLFLAEVELPSEDTPVRPPVWLARYIEREVTGEPEYVNLNLAR